VLAELLGASIFITTVARRADIKGRSVLGQFARHHYLDARRGEAESIPRGIRLGG